MHYFGVALQQPTTTDEQSYQEYNLGEETGIPREIKKSTVQKAGPLYQWRKT